MQNPLFQIANRIFNWDVIREVNVAHERAGQNGTCVHIEWSVMGLTPTDLTGQDAQDFRRYHQRLVELGLLSNSGARHMETEAPPKTQTAKAGK